MRPSQRCPYNSGVNATLPSITPAPGGVEKTSTIEHPRLRLLPGALLPAHWLGGGLLHDRLPGIRQALAEGRLRLRTLPSTSASPRRRASSPGACKV